MRVNVWMSRAEMFLKGQRTGAKAWAWDVFVKQWQASEAKEGQVLGNEVRGSQKPFILRVTGP